MFLHNVGMERLATLTLSHKVVNRRPRLCTHVRIEVCVETGKSLICMSYHNTLSYLSYNVYG